MTDQELEQASQKELVKEAKRLIEKGHFRLYIAGDESKVWLIEAIKNMSAQIEGQQ
jgi:hypothetical protein